MSVNIRDFPDAGIIYAIEDNTGEDGYADVHDVANALGQETAKGLGVRLSWMHGFGMVEPHKKTKGRWRVARKGSVAIQQAESALLEIQNADRIEFTLLRRTVEHYKARKK